MRVLLAEDDPLIAQALREALAGEGFSVDYAADGETALLALQNNEHAIVLLDIGLPKLDGVKVLQQARQKGIKIPTIMITARDGLSDRILGLDAGADDYLIKPFEVPELMARIRAVVRRLAGQAQSCLIAGKVQLDLASHTVSYSDITQVLPAREFALLRTMAERPGMIFSREQLEEKLYGWGEEVESNAIEVLIHYIRKKYDKNIIRNVRGAGWMIPKES